MATAKNAQIPPPRLRASRACKACHERRVKCDAFENGVPCSRCKGMGLQGCDFINSRRGTYTRRKTKCDKPPGDVRGEESTVNVRPALAAPPNGIPHEQNRAPGIDSVDTVGEYVRNPGLPAGSRQPEEPPQSLVAEEDVPPVGNQTVPMLDLTTPESQASDTSRLSYREITWTSMFEHVLNSRRDQHGPRAIDKCSITYLGESFPLSMVLEDVKQGGRIRLHHPGPPIPDDSTWRSDEQQHPTHMLAEETKFLQAKGAFEYPHPEVLAAFTSTFLDRVYPCYPIVNRKEFLEQLRQKRVPWLLLHSFCFICSTFCPLGVLYREKFRGRKDARTHYYSKAKALFDTGYEVDKIVILQSVILLAFWAGGPNDYWNFYSWNSTGVTIAEAMGIHRSMNEANLKKEDVSLLRRLWWVLAIRDASCGALIGRPFRINMYYCDTEMLTLENFSDDLEDPEFAQHPLRGIFGLYQIHMAKLSLILRQIVQQKYDIKNGRLATRNLNDLLIQWRKDLPQELCLSPGSDNNVFSQCLAMAYDHDLILANLDKATFTLPTPQEGMEFSPTDPFTLVSAAAHRILDLACAIVRKSIQASMPHECFPALFLAEVVFYAQMRSPPPHRAALGRSAVNTCQMVWHNVMDTWDSAPWVMKLFDNLITNAQEDIVAEESVPQMAAHPVPSIDMSDVDFGGFPELWQSHPMLSSMFDLPMDQSQAGMNGLPFMFESIGGASDDL